MDVNGSASVFTGVGVDTRQRKGVLGWGVLLMSCVSATIFEQMRTEVYAGGNDGGRSTAFYCMMLESRFVPGTN